MCRSTVHSPCRNWQCATCLHFLAFSFQDLALTSQMITSQFLVDPRPCVLQPGHVAAIIYPYHVYSFALTPLIWGMCC